MAMPQDQTQPLGLLLSDDLIFTSRIVGTGRDLGLPVKAARSADALLALARQQTPRCVIVDLANPGLAIADFMSQLAAACSPMPFVVAYGSHVDTATLRAGREAGCPVVWPRSKFVEELPRAMASWFAGNAVSVDAPRAAPG
jgi:DNA-binding NarL/FixJ family response regulator